MRFRNYEGGLVDETGQVLWKAPKVVSLKMTPNQLLVAELEGGKQRYVDLCNLKVYADKPEVKRYGNFELLKVKHRCYSRTQEVYVSQKDFVDLGVIDRGFYLSILEVNVGHFCLLAGDKERCYRFCRRMTDGSIVVEDGGGSHYHVTEKQKIVKAVT